MTDLSQETQMEIVGGIMQDAEMIKAKAGNAWASLQGRGEQRVEHKDIEFLLYAVKQLEMKIKFLGGYHY